MKILILTQDITVKEIPQSYNTGFSLMVAQIAEALAAEGPEIYVSSSSLTNDTLMVKNEAGKKMFVLVKRKLKLLFTHLRWKDIPRAIRHAFSNHPMTIDWRFKLLKYTLSTGFNIHLIREIQPDVIFIHSLSPATIPYIKASLHTHKPFVLALHGLFSQLDKNDFTTQGERLLLPSLLCAGMPLTLVSSGIRQLLLDWYGWKECKEIHVIPNALNTKTTHHTEGNTISATPWKKLHRILTIGNLSIRKNQLQILRAFALLPVDVRSQSQLCLIGKDALNGQLQLEAERLGISESCSFTGALPHEEVFRWIKEADIMVLASISEGFGLSIIEGYHYGVPAVCFDRIEAFEDLYHKKCMMPAYEYTDNALANAIQDALFTPWDREFIRTFARKFNNHAMASAYLNVLKQAQPTNLSENEFDYLVDTYLK